MNPSFCRVNTSATGPLVCSIATRHASAVSFASAGLINVKSGIARNVDSDMFAKVLAGATPEVG